jgi:3-oxoacyl-[acyl-carrier-protein] synthase III
MRKQPAQFAHVRISSTGSYLPSCVRTNEEIVDGLATTPAWIEQNLGIKERRVAEPDEFTSDLAARAGQVAIENAGLDRNDIDLIIVATATPDRKSPSAACMAQAKMGISNHCPAFDLAAVCSGFLYALTVAAQFIESGIYRHVLVIGADTFSKITDWRDRNCVFFGDGAGAVVLSHAPQGGGFLSSLLHADGAGMDHFTVYPRDSTFTMNGKAVYETATTVLPQAIQEILCLHRLELKDVAMIVPHQPSIRVLKRTAELLSVPFGQVQTNLERHANTAGATIPLLLDQVNRQGLLEPGKLVLFAAIGSGWTWGAALYRWS